MIGMTLSHDLVYRGGRGMRTVVAVAARVCCTALSLLVAALLTAVALGGHGDSPNGVSQARAAPAVSAKRLFLWGGRAIPTSAWAEFCHRLPTECQIDPSEPAAITLTLSIWEAMVAVNEHVNATITALPDWQHWGVEDRWTYPDDGMGDCEDLQLLKRKLLVEEGLPRRALRMTVVFDEGGEGHAVLMALTDRGALILDNKRNAVLAWNQTGYTYLKREGSDGLAWASLVGRLSPVAGNISADLRAKALSSAPATSSSSPAPKGI